MIRFIELVEVLTAHALLIEQSGGRPGILSLARIHAAIEAPRQSFAGDDLYPTGSDKAAALGYFLTNGHGFADGNKRIGWNMLETFLSLNGREVLATQDEIVGIMLAVAGSDELRPISREAFAAWLAPRVRPVS